MQKNVRTDLAIDLRKEAAASAKPNKTAPIELDMSLLKHVAGGSPKGTWESMDAVVQSPKGTW